MSGLEEKGFGFGREAICRYWKQKEEGNMGFWFGRETVCGIGKRMTQEKKNKEDILVLTLFSWFVKLDKCQNFNQGI